MIIPTVSPNSPGLLNEFDLQIGESRLLLKVLVFTTPERMASHWSKVLKRPLGRGRALGCVSQFLADVLDPHTMRVKRNVPTDPMYFAVMGLCVKHLGTEVLCHESVHAALYYRARVGKRVRWTSEKEPDPDDSICYPAGRIMSAIVQHLRKKGLIL